MSSLRATPATPQGERGFRRTFTLTRTLAVAEFKLRYLDAKLSYFWCVARPLAFFAVLYLVFTHVGRFDRGVHHYGLYLLSSVVLWTFFAESTATAVSSLVRRRELVRKVAFPRVVIPLSVTVTSLLDLAMNLIALMAFVFLAGVSPRLSWLEVPVLLMLLTLFVAGISMLLSALYVRLRDVDQVWMVVRQGLFYATPTLYVAAALPGGLRRVLSANPLAAIFTQVRRALVDPAAPSAAATVGGAKWLLLPLGIILIVFVTGVVIFQRTAPHMAETL